MPSSSASTPQELRAVSGAIHDAYFDPDEVVFDESAGQLLVPFAQEAGPWWEPPPKQLIRRTRLFSEYRVPFMSGTLKVHHVTAVECDEGWGDMGMLTGSTTTHGGGG